MPEFRRRAEEAGMTDYVTKPIQKSTLLKAMLNARAKAIERRQARQLSQEGRHCLRVALGNTTSISVVAVHREVNASRRGPPARFDEVVFFPVQLDVRPHVDAADAFAMAPFANDAVEAQHEFVVADDFEFDGTIPIVQLIGSGAGHVFVERLWGCSRRDYGGSVRERDPRSPTRASTEQLRLTRRVRIAKQIRAQRRHPRAVETVALTREFEAPAQQIRERPGAGLTLAPLRVVVAAAAHLANAGSSRARPFRARAYRAIP